MLLDSPVCEFDLPAPPFNLADPSGQRYSDADLMGPKGLLVAFICNHCPYVKAVIDRLVDDAGQLQAMGVNVVAIMPNDYSHVPADSPAAMSRFATSHGFTFPYLIDEDQSVARAYGAVCTPDFFGYNSDGQLQYRGELDDARMGEPAGRRPALLDAMRGVAQTGRGPREQTPSMGCSIKWRE